jgi:glycerol-3-phosphate cytidylyltransferase
MTDKKYKIGYTSGVYDLFHIGHLNILRRAKERCEFLIVGVTTDELAYIRKNKHPVIPENERMEIVQAIRYVDKVIFQSDMNKLKVVQEYHVDAVFVGSDWKNSQDWNRYEKEFAEEGCDVVYLQHTDGVSSSSIRKTLESGK